MNCEKSPVVFVCFILLCALILTACKQGETGQSGQPTTVPTRTATPEIKLPPKFGVFYESAAGPVELEKKTEVAAANPSFLIYLQNIPSANKLRFRFVKASGGPFIVDAGTVTSSDSDKPKGSPKPGNYQNIFLLAHGEDAGVFEPQVTAVAGQIELYTAAYSGSLKPGEYLAFYFIDESKGQKPWEEAHFKFAGQFTVK